MGDETDEDKGKIKKSVNTPFKQQKLKSKSLVITADTVLPATFIVALILIPVGIGLFWTNEGIQNISVDYTNCFQQIERESKSDRQDKNGSTSPLPEIRKKCTDIINVNDSLKTCDCENLYFTVKKNIEGQVMMYYGLTNFYENQRRYLENRNYDVLKGKVGTPESPKIDKQDTQGCEAPYRYANKEETKVFFPCGAPANSMFQDEIRLFTDTRKEIPLLRTGIAWPTDKLYGFRNPPWFKEAAKNPNHTAWKIFVKPRSWRKNLFELDPTDPDNNGLQNEDFIVWMRSAAFGNFKKLYRLLDHNIDCEKVKDPLNTTICADKEFVKKFKAGLPKGRYYLKILFSFPVANFGGTKSILISSNNVLGGKNIFIAYSPIGVGCCFLLLGLIFILLHKCYGRRYTLNYLKQQGEQLDLKRSSLIKYVDHKKGEKDKGLQKKVDGDGDFSVSNESSDVPSKVKTKSDDIEKSKSSITKQLQNDTTSNKKKLNTE